MSEGTSDDFHIRRADVSEILDLRWRILRAGLPESSANFEGDDEPTARHFAAIKDGRVVGCLTMLRRTWNNAPAWQLRGMAVDPICQRSGIGMKLLDAVEEMARTEPYSLLLWCNARSPARKFYEKAGWSVASAEFEMPSAGPHFKMTKRL
jgi:GNAT superfamily N-acetyltransferase